MNSSTDITNPQGSINIVTWTTEKLHLHRIDGPAYIRGDGQEEWWVNGKEIDIKPILEKFDISPDWKSWTDADKMIVRLALP